jgi:hypothetical protein
VIAAQSGGMITILSALISMLSFRFRRARRQFDNARSTTFTVSLEGITETEAAGPQKFCTTIAIARKRQNQIPTMRL